jgi:hypothetical protein
MTRLQPTQLLAVAVLMLSGCSEAARVRTEPWPERVFDVVPIRDVTSADILFVIDNS